MIPHFLWHWNFGTEWHWCWCGDIHRFFYYFLIYNLQCQTGMKCGTLCWSNLKIAERRENFSQRQKSSGKKQMKPACRGKSWKIICLKHWFLWQFLKVLWINFWCLYIADGFLWFGFCRFGRGDKCKPKWGCMLRFCRLKMFMFKWHVSGFVGPPYVFRFVHTKSEPPTQG